MDDSIPSEVKQIIREQVEKFPSDTERAVREAEKLIHKMASPKFSEFVDVLVRHCIMELAYDERHKINTKIKSLGGYYDTKPKVNLGSVPSVGAAYESVYNYCIGGSILGELTGAELEDLESAERGKAKGHIFNAELLKWLRSSGVRGDKKVKEVISENKLKIAFARILRNTQGGAA